jgi:hypothetical protein
MSGTSLMMRKNNIFDDGASSKRPVSAVVSPNCVLPEWVISPAMKKEPTYEYQSASL